MITILTKIRSVRVKKFDQILLILMLHRSGTAYQNIQHLTADKLLPLDTGNGEIGSGGPALAQLLVREPEQSGNRGFFPSECGKRALLAIMTV